MMLPKAELHLHLEGAIRPDLVRQLAARNGLPEVAEEIFDEHDGYRWSDFLDFLAAYERASDVIRTAEDYRDLTYAYLQESAAQGVIYTEVSASCEHVARHGMPYEAFLEGIGQGILDARRDFGIECRIISSMVRHYGLEKCLAVVKKAIAHPHELVTGIGLGGDEAGFPPGQFAKAYQMAHAHGLGCTVHAGEWAGPEGIREALDKLPVDRIGHGVRAIEDADLVQRLADEGIVLECSPGSNIALGVYPDYASHPLRRLYDAGVKVTLNSDDPPFFATTIGQEYETAQREFGFSDEALVGMTLTAIQSAYVDETTKTMLREKALKMAADAGVVCETAG